MSSVRPPPLQWLPAFEATARLLSFSKAAQELHVTTSAVSQQVKQLEAYLGQSLFQRLARRVELTDAGLAYARLAADLLQRYRQGHEAFTQRYSRPALRISMTPLVAYELVLPALGRFQAEHPDLDLHIDASMALVDFDDASVDAALRFGLGPWKGLEAMPLSRCRLVFVTAPKLAARHKVKSLADLSKYILIHQRADRSDWDQVGQRLLGAPVPRKGDLVLDSNLAALRAAEQGLGVAVAVLPLVQPWLSDGRLVSLMRPIDLSMGDYFLFRPRDPRKPQLMQVHRWLKGLFESLSSP
jgi:DNA-binding transcriptional LysR family regulator